MVWTRRGVCVMALAAALLGWSDIAAGQSQTGNITGRATGARVEERCQASPSRSAVHR